MKLTLVIAAVAVVLTISTAAICLSGAITARTTEYGSTRAALEQLFNRPAPSVCR